MYIITGLSKFKDNKGEKIHFKEGYYDAAFRKYFNSAAEKHEYMKTHNFVWNGDSDEKCKREKQEHESKKQEGKRG